MEKLQKIAREKGMFLMKCAEGNADRKYQITYEYISDTRFFKDLKEIRIFLGLEEFDGIPSNIR